MWAPGEILDVEDEVAEELVESPRFTLVRSRRVRRKVKKKSEEKLEE